ncbi:glycosyltransferase family 2 protein [Streptosporangium soli]|nr:glycosyltransferase [Streptosporangium sp. KLBMP 9127]
MSNPAAAGLPKVSVLMPTYQQEAFIPRAIESLRAQTYRDWELVIVNDGSHDRTHELLHDLLEEVWDDRVTYLRNERNLGLGAALNLATRHATGTYISYLPSDDIYHADHLERLVAVLEESPRVYIAYGGVHIAFNRGLVASRMGAATLRGDDVIGHEIETLNAPAPVSWLDTLKSGNTLAMVQVMHRRDSEEQSPWTTRDEYVSDAIEADQWRRLIRLGATFRYAGKTTCQWVQHPLQHHRIIGGTPGRYGWPVGGLPRYRSFYGVPAGQYLDWRPWCGRPVHEKRRSDVGYSPPPGHAKTAGTGLRILVVGDLGFNPERLLVLEQAGHELAGLWHPDPDLWMATGPFPWGHIRDIPATGDWRRAAADFRPDVIYAGLNWSSIPLAEQVMDAGLDAPFVWHFKESPGHAIEHALWPGLVRLMSRSDGRIFINDECRTWFELALRGIPQFSGEDLIMDGDMPPRDWFHGEFRPKLSERTGEAHTVCAGMWRKDVDEWKELAEAGIHVHIYGQAYHELAGESIPKGVAGGYVHLHPAVEPQQWVSELSQYDAGWLHVFDSVNHGELRGASWPDLNYPGRLSSYAAAGLPWILADSHNGSTSAIRNLARRYAVDVPFSGIPHLGAQLHDSALIQERTANMRRHRDDFTFDAHVPRLGDYFRRVIASRRRRAD